MDVQSQNRSAIHQLPLDRSARNSSGDPTTAGMAANVVWNGLELAWYPENGSTLLRYGSVFVAGLDDWEYRIKASGVGDVAPGERFPLPPGETVTITLTVNSSRTAACDFEVFLNKHNTSAMQDGGTAMGDKAKQYHWVPAPSARDIGVELTPSEILLRPWHFWGFGSPRAEITISNKASLKLTVQPQMRRGDAPESAEPVGDMRSYVIEPGHYAPLPVTLKLNRRDKNQNFKLWANGMVTPPNELGSPFSVSSGQSIFVEYVPFRKLFRDYALMALGLGALGTLFALIWGIPEQANLIVDLHIQNAALAHSKRGDLQVELLSRTNTPVSYRPLTELDSNTYRFNLPKRWLWYRPIFGWNDRSQEPQHYDIKLSGDVLQHFTMGHMDPIALSYTDKGRKFHDRNYVPKYEVPVVLDRIPLPGHKANPSPTPPSLVVPSPHPPKPPNKPSDSPPRQPGPEKHENHPGGVGTTILPNSPKPVPKPTQAQQQAIKNLCGHAGLPLRADNPLNIDLKAFSEAGSSPGVLSFKFTVPKPCYFQLYSFRGDKWHSLLQIRTNAMTNNPEPALAEPDISKGETQKAWANSDIPPTRPQDDAKDNKEIEYILLAVAADAPGAEEGRADLMTFVNTLGEKSSQWSVVSWKGHRDAPDKPFAETPFK